MWSHLDLLGVFTVFWVISCSMVLLRLVKEPFHLDHLLLIRWFHSWFPIVYPYQWKILNFLHIPHTSTCISMKRQSLEWLWFPQNHERIVNKLRQISRKETVKIRDGIPVTGSKDFLRVCNCRAKALCSEKTIVLSVMALQEGNCMDVEELDAEVKGWLWRWSGWVSFIFTLWTVGFVSQC